jgi:hypothetical protein
MVRPTQLDGLLNLRSLFAYRPLSGLTGLEKVLQTNPWYSLSLDETILDAYVSFATRNVILANKTTSNDSFSRNIQTKTILTRLSWSENMTFKTILSYKKESFI